MSSPADDAPETDWLTLAELAERTGTDVRRVRQLLRDGRLVAVRREGRQVVPAAFVAGGELLRGLGGLVTVLHDAGYDDEESVRWMLAPDPTLGTAPVQAMADGRSTEVKRIAQTLGF